MDYKEKYEQAINRAKAMIEVANNQEEIYNSAITIFPELQESEDEEIRKFLIQMAQNGHGEDRDWWNKCVAWLEKQGEHAKFRDSIQVGDKVTRNEDGMLVNLSQLNRVAKKDEKQGEQKLAEWSEEDEWCLEQINFLIRNSYSVDDKVERLSNWVKSIKDRVQC